ncbi:MAG: hypothetical protein GKR93_16880 [Gammaproteobacteria bacterium]|nr:hypothetical protein [Gammaproteobacteria bacterium]
MAIFPGSLQRSLSRLELGVALIVIFILSGLFLRQVLILSARAEQSFLEVSVLNMNTALHYQAGLLYMQGEKQKLQEMDGMNPFTLMQSGLSNSIYELSVLPSKYQGEIGSLQDADILPGHWYYLGNEKILIYKVSNDEFFESDNSTENWIRFRVNLNYEDKNNDARFEWGEDLYSGVKLQNLGGYRWEI